MGCDIHLYVEVRNENGEWESPENWTTESEYGEKYLHVPYEEQIYTGRNYDLFALLAGVRNYDGVVPIDEPRGVPCDCSEILRQYINEWGTDGHRHSHFTLKELLAFDWTLDSEHSGIIEKEVYLDWCSYGRSQKQHPKMWAGAVFSNSPTIEMEEADRLIAEARDTAKRQDLNGRDFHDAWRSMIADQPWGYVNAKWAIPTNRSVGEFWSEAMPKLTKYLATVGGDTERVRIVFFFDN